MTRIILFPLIVVHLVSGTLGRVLFPSYEHPATHRVIAAIPRNSAHYNSRGDENPYQQFTPGLHSFMPNVDPFPGRSVIPQTQRDRTSHESGRGKTGIPCFDEEDIPNVPLSPIPQNGPNDPESYYFDLNNDRYFNNPAPQQNNYYIPASEPGPQMVYRDTRPISLPRPGHEKVREKLRHPKHQPYVFNIKGSITAQPNPDYEYEIEKSPVPRLYDFEVSPENFENEIETFYQTGNVKECRRCDQNYHSGQLRGGNSMNTVRSFGGNRQVNNGQEEFQGNYPRGDNGNGDELEDNFGTGGDVLRRDGFDDFEGSNPGGSGKENPDYEGLVPDPGVEENAQREDDREFEAIYPDDNEMGGSNEYPSDKDFSWFSGSEEDVPWESDDNEFEENNQDPSGGYSGYPDGDGLSEYPGYEGNDPWESDGNGFEGNIQDPSGEEYSGYPYGEELSEYPGDEGNTPLRDNGNGFEGNNQDPSGYPYGEEFGEFSNYEGNDGNGLEGSSPNGNSIGYDENPGNEDFNELPGDGRRVLWLDDDGFERLGY